jgi:hypothetical protein
MNYKTSGIGILRTKKVILKHNVMKAKLLYVTMIIAAALLLHSCAKLPVSSVSLMQQIKDEGTRMHKLNIAYVNMLFENKKAAVDSFIENEYTQAYIKRTKELMDGNNFKVDNTNWQSLLPKMLPVINAARDSLQNTLAENKNRLVEKLNEDYGYYKQACDAQIALLSSATKLNNASRQVFNSIAAKITGGKTDLTMLEQRLDGALKKGSSIAEKILGINEAVQAFTNK